MHSYKRGSLQGSHTTIFGIVVDRERIATEAPRVFLAHTAHERKFYKVEPFFHFHELGMSHSSCHMSVDTTVDFLNTPARTTVCPELQQHL
tara:strand:+ start:27531 stop:27803 length:273 start_codon:yes stop_codon:yes gene_type:complete